VTEVQLSKCFKAFEKVYNQVFVYIELYLNCDASILQSFLVYGIMTDPEIEWPALSLGHLAAISYLIRRRLRLKRLSVSYLTVWVSHGIVSDRLANLALEWPTG